MANNKKMIIYISDDMHFKLKHLAVDLHTSISAMVREAIDDYLNKLRNKDWSQEYLEK